jgi:hypothetical protein
MSFKMASSPHHTYSNKMQGINEAYHSHSMNVCMMAQVVVESVLDLPVAGPRFLHNKNNAYTLSV